MIAPETLEFVTLVGALVTVMIAISQIQTNALHRANLDHGLDILDLAKKLNCDEASFNSLVKTKLQSLCTEEQGSLSTLKFIWRMFVGIVVLTGFSCLSANLFMNSETLWGIIAAIFALIGLIMLILAWTDRKQLSATVEEINRGIATYAPAPVASPAAASVETPKAAEARAERAAVAEPKSVPEARPAAAAPRAYKIKIPTDSILKRHFITHIRSEIAAGMSPRPTDSILQRHYDHLLETRLAMRLAEMEG